MLDAAGPEELNSYNEIQWVFFCCLFILFFLHWLALNKSVVNFDRIMFSKFMFK